MAFTELLKCPSCQGLLDPDEYAEAWRSRDKNRDSFQCPHCGTRIRFSPLHLIASYTLGFSASMALSYLVGLRAYAAPLWIPIFVVCFLAAMFLTAPFLARLVVDRKSSLAAKSSVRRNLMLFLSFWFGAVVAILCYAFVLGWISVASGGTARDVREITDAWSVPLGLVNPAFIIKPDTSFVSAVGIVSANCYFYALALMLVFNVVHYVLRRNRVTELGLSSPTLKDDDET